MSVIKYLWAREILDSRGIPTIEAALQLDSGHVLVNAVPSGTSTGTYEALELRDSDPERFQGNGVLKAVDNINKIIGPKLKGFDSTKQEEVDKILIEMDGTKNKSKLGANAILAVSELITKAGALSNKISLYNWINIIAKNRKILATPKIPTPMFNMINGGRHGAGNLDFQEFHIIPSSTKPYKHGLQSAVEIYHIIGDNLHAKGAIHSVGHEGGYAPNLFTNADALQLLVESIKSTKYALGRDIILGLDVAASEFFKNNSYLIRDRTSPLDENSLIEFYKLLNDQYHMAILEDALDEDSWEGWTKMTSLLGGQTIIVGDDLLVTNPERVKKAIEKKSCNGILIKPNQIGTITETLDVIKMARDANWKVIVSHRSGETNDSFISDFAVGVGSDYVKFGAPARGERIAKYNRLLSIDVEINGFY